MSDDYFLYFMVIPIVFAVLGFGVKGCEDYHAREMLRIERDCPVKVGK